MSDSQRPIAALTELRGRIQPDDTTIPVIATSPFTVAARKKIGDEFVLCSGFGVDAFGWPVMTGCQRGQSPEEGGVAARSWAAGTPVSEVGWTTTEGVTTLPAVAEEGRSVDLGGITYFGQDRGDGVIQWVALNDATFDAGTLTIVSDAVTLPRIPPNIAIINLTVDTEGGAATDTLKTITPTGSIESGTLIVIRGADNARDVTISSGGNFSVGFTFSVFTLHTVGRRFVAAWDAALSTWAEVTQSSWDLAHLADTRIDDPPTVGDTLVFDGTSWVNEPGSGLFVPFFAFRIADSSALGAGAEWTNQPAGTTELFGQTFHRRLADLTYLDRFLFGAEVFQAGSAVGVISLEYSTNLTTPSWTAIANSLLSVAAVAQVHTGWQNIPAGAKALVLLRVVGSGGNATADPRFSSIAVQCR